MRFGLDIPVSGDYSDPRLLADLARDAETAGWDGVFLQDVFSGPDPAVDPWIALAAVALATERVRIGCFLTPLARRRPWQVARQAVTVDHLSRGRLVFGAALGYSAQDFVAFGEEWDPLVRAGKLDEALEIVTGLWNAEPFSYNGSHYRLDGALLRPAPWQTPRIPVWVAAGWPRRKPLRRAARWDGVYLMTVHQDTGELLTPDDVAGAARFLAEASPDGTDPIDVAINAEPVGDAGADAARIQAFAGAGATWWIELADDDHGPGGYRERIRRGPPRH